MKKLLIISGLFLSVALQAATFQSFQFLSDTVATNASAASKFAGITITNAAAAPLGGYTNVQSWSYSKVIPGTNSLSLTWTNNNGIWVIPTNNTPGTLSGVQFIQTPESTSLTKDVPLYPLENGGIPYGFYPGFSTNSVFPGSATVANGEAAMFSTARLSCRISGDTSAANTLNLIFVGVPDGLNGILEDSSLTQTAIPAFQWGITAAAGTTVISTNLPIWRFSGCGAIRLRSATLTTTTAASIGVTIQDLRLSEFVPIQK